jgi:predicted ATPase
MINYIKIEGFRSIKSAELTLEPINILIGANGSGKSNFIGFFKLVNAIFSKRLQAFIEEERPDNILHFGRKNTDVMKGKMIFSESEGHNNAYSFTLAQTKVGGLFIHIEGSGYNVSVEDSSHNWFFSSNTQESKFAIAGEKRHRILQEYISALKVFHFHDTSSTSNLRKPCDVDDNQFLKSDGRNLPAFLYLLKSKFPQDYLRIEKAIQSVAPFISEFILEPRRLDEREIELRWIDRGDPESNFNAYQLSDGTLRFIALTTLLLQPEPPDVIIIDEPELGLHPFAVGKLAGLIKSSSASAQIIVATQSPGLLNNFTPEDVIVIDRDDKTNESSFHRLSSNQLSIWLEEFSLGDLWQKNILNSAQPFSK